MLKPIFHLPQTVQATCQEGKVPDLLAQLSFCAEPKLAAHLKRGFPASLNRAPGLLHSSGSALRRLGDFG